MVSNFFDCRRKALIGNLGDRKVGRKWWLTIFLLIAVWGCREDTSPPVRHSCKPKETGVEVVELKFFYGDLGDSTPKSPESVELQVYLQDSREIAPEQQAAIADLVANEQAIHVAVRKALYEHYKETYPHYKKGLQAAIAMFGGSQEDAKAMLPEVLIGNELDHVVQFGNIYIHPVRNGKVAIGVDFIVPWDEDGAMGLLLIDGTVEQIGTAYEAFPWKGEGT
ncbi:MAG: hypothetical protein PVH19_15425 [Planctomycetia bacterium]